MRRASACRSERRGFNPPLENQIFFNFFWMRMRKFNSTPPITEKNWFLPDFDNKKDKTKKNPVWNPQLGSLRAEQQGCHMTVVSTDELVTLQSENTMITTKFENLYTIVWKEYILSYYFNSQIICSQIWISYILTDRQKCTICWKC